MMRVSRPPVSEIPTGLASVEVAWQVPHKSVLQLGVILRRLEPFLFLPFPRMEIGCLVFERAATKNPSGSRRKNVNAGKESSVFEHASTSNKLSQSARLDGAQLRPYLQDCLCLRRKVNGIFGLMVIEPLQAESVIEEHHGVACTVGN